MAYWISEKKGGEEAVRTCHGGRLTISLLISRTVSVICKYSWFLYFADNKEGKSS